MNAGRVAVIVPVYRNAATLSALAARLDAALAGPWTLRLVVDACPAGSGAVAAALAARDCRIRVSQLPVNVGQHRAIVHGLLAETGADTWVCLDGDLQDPPEAIPSLLYVREERSVAGVFAGRRGAYQARGRRLTGTLHRRALRLLTGLPVDAGAFLAMNRPLRDAIVAGVLQRGAPSVVVAAGCSGLPLDSVPVQRDLRAEGHSSWTSRARLRQSLATLAWAARERRGQGLPREIARFLLIGAAGTAGYLCAYLALRLAMPAQHANLIARVALAVPTTWLNGRYTFGRPASPRRLITGALAVLSAGAAVSAGLLVIEQALLGPSQRWAEIATLVVANALATLARFVLLRQWLFRRRPPEPPRPDQHPAPAAASTTTSTEASTALSEPGDVRVSQLERGHR